MTKKKRLNWDNIFTTGAVIFGAWFVISWLEVVIFNTNQAEHYFSSLNLFMIIFG